jgi:hypothetical protein
MVAGAAVAATVVHGGAGAAVRTGPLAGRSFGKDDAPAAKTCGVCLDAIYSTYGLAKGTIERHTRRSHVCWVQPPGIRGCIASMSAKSCAEHRTGAAILAACAAAGGGRARSAAGIVRNTTSMQTAPTAAPTNTSARGRIRIEETTWRTDKFWRAELITSRV